VSKASAASDRPWSSTAPPGEFRPYISPEETLKEFTIRAVVLGALFGLLFGAVTVYVGLRAGLTVSASIPISVLSISILRAFGRSTILENNIVQTTGSAGESLAAGVMFTIPALIFLGFGSEFTFWRIFPLALLGGWLGVLFMVPLRRQLIVKEHGNLVFPEGTACADVLVAGERGGSFAGRVFWGLGLGGVYTFLMNTVQAWTAQPESRPSWFPGASFRLAITSEYLGVGYIIGSRVAGILFAGGIISWLVIMPAIKFYGQLAGNTPIYPSTIPIPQMTPDQLWSNYIRPMAAGAVAAAGLIDDYFCLARRAQKRARRRRRAICGDQPNRSRGAHALGRCGLRFDHCRDVGAAYLSSHAGRANPVVAEPVCRRLRHCIWLSFCDSGSTHQRLAR
jgi:putative OPT family oligopeptide transporter